MAGFDTSNVAATVGPQQPQNPFGLIEGLATARNALNQNNLFQAKQIAGQYLEQSIGPDGQPDPSRLNAFLSADPRTAAYAPEILENAFALKGAGLHNVGADIANRRAGLGLQSDQAALASTYTGNLRQDLATIPPSTNPDPALAAKENASRAAMAVANGVSAGRYPQAFATSFLGGNATPDGATLATAVKSAAISGAGGAGAEEAQFGSPTAVQTGAGTTMENVNRVTGQVEQMKGPGAFVPAAQSPSEMGQLVSYTAPDGSVRQIPKSAIQRSNGTGIPNVKDAAGNEITDASGALTTALPANDLALLNSTAHNQADRATSLQTAFEGSTQRKALVQEMLALNGDFKSGPGAAKWSGIVTEANRILGTNFASDASTAQQVFGKIAEMLSAQQRETLGLPATNAGAEAAHLASPNTVYSPDANREVLAQFAGNEDLLQRKEAAWTWYQKHGGKSYNTFIQQFNATHDPRMFWEPYMSDKQRATMRGGMTPTQQQAYDAAKAKADKMAAAFAAVEGR